MVMTTAGLEPENDRTGEAEEQHTQPLFRKGAPRQQTRKCVKMIIK
jgi:hypothetical protein